MQYQHRFSNGVLPVTSETPPTTPTLASKTPLQTCTDILCIYNKPRCFRLGTGRLWLSGMHCRIDNSQPQQTEPGRLVLCTQKPAQLHLLHFSSRNKQLRCLRPSFPAQTRFFSCETARVSWETQTYRIFLPPCWLIHGQLKSQNGLVQLSTSVQKAVRFSPVHKIMPLLKWTLIFFKGLQAI